MSDTRPAIEILASAFVYGNEVEIKKIEKHRLDECASMRAIVCTNDPSAVNLELGLGISSNSHVVPLLKGPYAWFHSHGVSIQTRLANNKSTVLIDYSLGFDSNFAEKLRAFIHGENIEQADRDAVNGILMLKAKNKNVQFDVMPFLIENMRLVRDNPSNRRPLETLTAFRMLDSLDWESFRKNSDSIVFCRQRDILEDECRLWYSDFLSKLNSENDILKIERQCLSIQALLLRFARLTSEHKMQDKNKILHELLRFCIFKIGFVPRTELHMIWNGMSTKDGLPFFGPITGKSHKILSKIRSMSWDMTIMRNVEKNFTMRKECDFFVPYFVSLDKRLRDLIRFGLVKKILIDDKNEQAFFIRINELEFQTALDESMQMDDIRNEMEPSKIEGRRRYAQEIDFTAMKDLVINEEKYWKNFPPIAQKDE